MARSVVALGKFNRRTMEVTYFDVEAWKPEASPAQLGVEMIDHDEKRKQALEDKDPEDFSW